MKKLKVINRANLPTRLPIVHTAVTYLFLDKFNAVEWVWEVVGIIFAIVWIFSIVAIFIEEQQDVIE